MKFLWIATLALAGSAMAMPAQAKAKTLAPGAACTKDGKMGVCQSGICIQDVHASQGVCK
ncbi:hypothetical protein BJY04DRAFT_219060 [Aspergillus karnatakaensis]|uniref:uncharacterized protein n=1 Tax=Aspergillus karnatakaensis TaxID=1810916 RepID=UPI003CCCB9B0